MNAGLTAERRAAEAEGTLVLQRNGFVRLYDPQGWRIECVSGCAWITQDGDLHDTVVAPGQCHVVQGPARLLLQALDDCTLRIRPDANRLPTRLVSHAHAQPLRAALPATSTGRRTVSPPGCRDRHLRGSAR